MCEQSIEDLREFIKSSRLISKELHSKNEKTEFYSKDKLIQLLEEDNTLNGEQHEEPSHDAEKTTSDNIESQNGSNVLNVMDNNLEGLTLEIRESLYSKLVTALSSNYRTSSSKQSSPILTESDICAVAKKIELGTLSVASNLYSYKFSGVEKVIDIEKQTRNRNLCEALHTEIELLRLRDRTQSILNESNCQDLSSDMSVEAEPTSCKETQCQVNQSNAKIMTADDVSRVPTKLPVLPDTVASESEYFTCSDNSNPIDIQQNNETNTLKSCTQDPLINISKPKILEEAEPTKNDQHQSISTQNDVSVCASNNHVEKNTIEPCTDLKPIDSCGESKTDPTNIGEDSSKKKRKRISEGDLEPSTICSSVDRNGGLLSHSIDIASTCTKINPLRKKHKVMEIERFDGSTCGGNENVTILKTQSENSSLVRLDSDQDAKTNETVPFVRIKIEPDGTINDKCDGNVRNENINSVETNRLEIGNNHVGGESPRTLSNFHCNIMSKIKEEIDVTHYSMPKRCRIKCEVDVSQYSMRINCEGNCNEKIPDEISLKSSTVSLPIYRNEELLRRSTDIAGTREKPCLPREKDEFMENGMTSDLLKITNNYAVRGADKNGKTLTVEVKNRSKITTLDRKQDQKIHEVLPLEKMKLEPNDEEVTLSPLSPTGTSVCDFSLSSSREKNSTQESANDESDKFRRKVNIVSAGKNNQGSSNILAKLHRHIMSKIKKELGVPHYSAPIVCTIKSETDDSHFPIRMDQEENCDRQTNNEISLNKEKVSSDFEDSNKARNDSVILQNSESICGNQTSSPHAPTRTGENTEVTVVENRTVTDSEENKDHNENIVVRKRKSLIDEEAFERERARLDKQFGRDRLDEESRKVALDKVLEKMNKRNQESRKGFYIFGEHERLFEIVVPIMREYYPSYFIPDELCYSKVLQRLQVDLAGADMNDNDIASYTRDSIKTMRYLCDHCIVQ